MKHNKCYFKIEELAYYFFFGILFAAKGIGLEYGQKPFYLCMVIALFCFCLKMSVTAHTVKEWLLMSMMVMLGIAIYFSSGELAAMAAFLVIIGIKNIPVKRLMAVCLGIWGTSFVLSLGLGFFHIRDGVVVVHEKLGLGPIIRWSLGYTHPNVLHVSYLIFVILLLYVFEWEEKQLWKTTVFLFLGNILIFLFSVSYTGILVVTAYLILNLYLQMRKNITKAEAILLQCICPFCVIFPLAGPFVLKGKAFDFFNKLLSTRFELVYNIFHEFSPSLFGTSVHFENTMANLTLDSSFAYLLMHYGIIAFVLFIIGYFFMIHHFVKTGEKKELAMVLSIVFAGITEQFLFNLSFKNLTFFFLGEYFFEIMKRSEGKECFWNKEICILRRWQEKNICLPDYGAYMKTVGRKVLSWSKKLTFLVAIAGILAGMAGAFIMKLPDSVYVNRWKTDYRNEDEEVYLDMDAVSEEFNSIVIGYNGNDVGMYCFTGNIITMEWIRNTIGAAALGSLSICILAFGTAAIKIFSTGDEKRHEGSYCE